MALDARGKITDRVERRFGDDQIGVITLIRLMWKWKIVILVGILICSLAALFISILMPHVYEVDILVENVQVGKDKTGKAIYLGNLKETKNLIASGVFSQDISRDLKQKYGEAFQGKISFQVSLENNNQFARVGYETANVELGKKILLGLSERLKEKSLERIEYWKKEINGKIQKKRDEIINIESKIVMEKTRKEELLAQIIADKAFKADELRNLRKERDKLISERISYLNAERSKQKEALENLDKLSNALHTIIKSIEIQIDFLVKTRNDLFSKGHASKDLDVTVQLLSSLIDGYSQLTKFNIRFIELDNERLQAKFKISEMDARIQELKSGDGEEFTQLNSKIEKVALESEKLELPPGGESGKKYISPKVTANSDPILKDVLQKFEDKKSVLMTEIASLGENKKKVQNMVVIQPPISGVSSLRPDTKRNVVIGAVVGMFLSLFLSVFLEYVYKKDGSRRM